MSKDLEAQGPQARTTPAQAEAPAVPPPVVPLARITLTIPEELRYRLKLAVMNHRRVHRDHMTQDEFCVQAITSHLEREDPGPSPDHAPDPLVAFLHDCLTNKGLNRTWAAKAEALLKDQLASGSAPPDRT